MTMPGDITFDSGNSYFGGNLTAFVNNGSIAEARLDDMATRLLASWYKYAPFPKPGVNANSGVDARTTEASKIIFQAAVEGHVLVKNVNSALPLKRPQTLSIFGYDAVSGYNTSASDPSLYPLGLTNTKEYTNGQAFGALQYILLAGSIMQGTAPAAAADRGAHPPVHSRLWLAPEPGRRGQLASPDPAEPCWLPPAHQCW